MKLITRAVKELGRPSGSASSKARISQAVE
jgi:hypothetical protein